MKLRNNKIINPSLSYQVKQPSIIDKIAHEEKMKAMKMPIPFSKQFIHALAFPSTFHGIIIYLSCIFIMYYSYLIACYLVQSVWKYPIELMFISICMMSLIRTN